jgi:hypothetical protein
MSSPDVEQTTANALIGTRRWTAVCLALLLVLLLIFKIESRPPEFAHRTDNLISILLFTPPSVVLLLLRPGAGFAAGAAHDRPLRSSGTARVRADTLTIEHPGRRPLRAHLGGGALTSMKCVSGTIFLTGQRRVYAIDDELRLQWIVDLAPLHPDLGFELELLHADTLGLILSDQGRRLIAVNQKGLQWITQPFSEGSFILAASRAANGTVYFTATGVYAGLSFHAVRR